jgi:predicted MFS family arabinose efflux permease
MLGFVYIFNFLDRQLMSVLIEPIKKEMGFDDAQMGWMTGFWFAVVYTLLGVVVGFLADRTSRRNILFAGAFLWSGFTALCGLAPKGDYTTMLISRMGVGVGEAAGAPPSYSIISDYFPPEKRALALALFSLGVPFGQAAGVAFGAGIDGIWGWRAAFISIGIAGVIASFLLLLIVREPKRGAMDHSATVSQEQAEANASVKEGFIPTLWEFLNRPMLLWTALACGLCAFVGYVALGWNASYLQRVRGMTPADTAVWYALMLAISMGLGTWFSGAISDWLAKRSKVWYALLPAIAMTLSAPFWFAYVWAPTWQMALAILSVPTFLTIVYLAPALAVIQNSVKPSQRTMAGAILLMILNMIGLGGGPTLAGEISKRTSFAQLVDSGMTAEQAGTYLRMPRDVLLTQTPEIQQTVGAASGEGLQTALYWMTPFYGVAVFFLVLMALAIRREIKNGGQVRDGGARLGIVLLLVGAGGLAARYIMGGIEGVMSTDTMQVIQLALILLATLLGLIFSIGALTRKKPATA